MADLADALYFSDLSINTCSTMTLDSLAMSKPVINIGFDMFKTSKQDSVERFYRFDHYLPITESSAVPIVSSFEQLTDEILRFVKDPDYLLEERVKLRDLMLAYSDVTAETRIESSC